MFFFFRTETAARVAGPFDQSFWTVDLLRATQLHPAIWHASIAVAAMHKRYTVPARGPTAGLRRGLYEFALAQYNASISGLVGIARAENPSPDDKDIILAASVLYAGLCSLRGDPKEAFLHMRSGLRLFRQWKHWERRGRRGRGVLPADSIITLFNRFDTQALNLLDDKARTEWEGRDIPRQPSGAPFASVTEAYFEFELTLNGLVDLRQRKSPLVSDAGRPCSDRENRRALRGALDAWSAKFAALQPLLKDSEAEAALILRIRQIAFDMALSADPSRWELAWDDFLPQYEQIVTLSRRLLEEHHPAACGAPTFSFAASVCEPLYVTASSCRHASVRREAISLLRRWPRRECLWDSVLAASLAESIMLLEESAAAGGRDDGGGGGGECYCVEGAFICHGHRVADAKLELLGEGVGMVTLRTVNDVVGERRGQIIQLSW
ncbi:hypothetical protein VUR80DRAFT_6462 [Thermomyces stellatus]